MNPYIVGFVASDGHVGKFQWLISQSHKSVDVLYKIRKFFGGRLRVQNSDNSYSTKMKYNLSFYKKRDCNPFEEWGVPEGNKTYNLRFPKDQKDEDIWLYLRGFFEGDGSISTERNNKYPRVQIISNMDWCQGCKEFMQKFNIRSYIHKDKRHMGIGSVIIRRVNSVHSFFDKIYEDSTPLFMDRKYYHWLEIKSSCPIIKERKDHKILSEQDLKEIQLQLSSGVKVKNLEEKYGNEPILIRINKEAHPKYIAEKEKQAEAYIKEGKNRGDLQKLGISNLMAKRVFKKIKKDIPYKQGIPLMEEHRKKVIEFLKQGLKAKKISFLLNISSNTVHRINREITGGFKIQNKIQREEKKKLVKKLIRKGLGRNEIYRNYHINKDLIKKAREEMYVEDNGV